jgi:hypothetical protein
MDADPQLKAIIEELVCPVHNQHPVVIHQKDGSIQLTCCCAEFKIQCFHLLKKMTSNQREG